MKRGGYWPVILVTEPAYFKSVLSRLRRVGRVQAGSPARRRLAGDLPGADAAVVRVETRLDRRLLEGAPRLRLIASATTGIDHIDLDAARRGNIRVLHLHGTHTIPTAEHTLALLLALARRVAEVQPVMRAGGWNRARWIGTQISGKTIGIVGLGRIGRAVAKLARAHGMVVLAYDPYVRGRRGIQMCRRLQDLLRRSDVVSIHAALTAETRGMIGARELRLMRRGAFLVNTARGAIADERAILAALRHGRLGGAALDVFSTEPLPAGSPLRAYARSRGNLILTPHLGASTHEAVEAAAAEIARGVERFFS